MTAKFVTSFDIFDRLHDCGVIQHEPNMVRRVVIDLEAGKIALVYVELFADSEKLFAALRAGVEVAGESSPIPREEPA